MTRNRDGVGQNNELKDTKGLVTDRASHLSVGCVITNNWDAITRVMSI